MGKAKIGCVIMAAGQGRRFGGNKLLAPLAGKPLLAHVLDSLPLHRLDRTVVVTTHDEVEDFCRPRDLEVRRSGSGLLSESVRRGIEVMDGLDGCIFLMGDQPLCSPATLEGMLDAFSLAPQCVHRLSFAGTPSSPVIFPASLFPRLAALKGEESGMTAVRDSGVEVRFFPAACAAELWDVDTPEMLEQAEAHLRSLPV